MMIGEMPTNQERTFLEGFLSYIAIWLRYKWFVIISTILITVFIVAVCVLSLRLPPEESFLPNYYTANGKIIVQQRAQDDIANTILSNLGVPTNVSTSRAFDYGSQIIALGKSRTILDQVIARCNLVDAYYDLDRDEVRNHLIANFQFQYSAATAIMNITYTDIDPVLAKEIVNGMITLLDEWYITNSNQAKIDQRKVLEEKLTSVKKDIERLGNTLKMIPEIDPSYSQYLAELDIQQRIYNSLFPQYEAARLVPESQPVFQVFELAEVPIMKSGPSRGQYVILGFAGSFFGFSAIAFALNALKEFKRKQFAH